MSRYLFWVIPIGKIDFPLNVINNLLLYTLNLTPYDFFFLLYIFIAVLKTSVSDSLIKFRISSWYCSQSVQESFTPLTFPFKVMGGKDVNFFAPPGSSSTINIKYLVLALTYILHIKYSKQNWWVIQIGNILVKATFLSKW